MTHFLDERTLQRCIDGELNEDEQQALLRQLDRSSDGWRVVALAFLEHQLWTQAGRDFVYEPPAPHVAPVDSEPETRRNRSWLRHVALAACTLIAVGLGYLGGTQRNWSGGTSPGSSQSMARNTAPAESPPLAQTEIASVSRASGSMSSSRSLTPVMEVQLMPEGENAQPITLPVYDAEDLSNYGPWVPPQLPPELFQNLIDQGVQIQQEPRYYSMPNDQNRQLVVPVNTIKLHQAFH